MCRFSVSAKHADGGLGGPAGDGSSSSGSEGGVCYKRLIVGPQLWRHRASTASHFKLELTRVQVIYSFGHVTVVQVIFGPSLGFGGHMLLLWCRASLAIDRRGGGHWAPEAWLHAAIMQHTPAWVQVQSNNPGCKPECTTSCARRM